MKLTNRSEYALLAMVFLARQKPGSHIHAQEIAEAQAIPIRFLQQILFTLKRGRFVVSVKGKSGGYALAVPAREISLAHIIRLFEGALAPTGSASKHFYEPSPIEREQKILEVMREVRVLVATKLEHISLADLV